MPGQQAGGNVIALDRLGLRIPVHMVLGLHGNPMQQASGTGAMADLCRSYRRFSRVNAVEPVSVLIVGCVDVIFRRPNR